MNTLIHFLIVTLLTLMSYYTFSLMVDVMNIKIEKPINKWVVGPIMTVTDVPKYYVRLKKLNAVKHTSHKNGRYFVS